MPFVLRFVQTYETEHRVEFMRWESMFVSMEQRRDDLPKGRRSQPLTDELPANTLIWESEFATLAEAHQAVFQLSSDEEHALLYRRQAPYMTGCRTEINEVLEFRPAEAL